MPTTLTKYCAKHTKVETSVTCASCGTPICTKCMVYTPVGVKCRECGLSRGGTLFTIRPERMILAAVTALVAGAIAALLGGTSFFYAIFIAVPYGYFAGQTIIKAAGMKRGLKLEIIAGVGMVIGALAFKLIPGLIAGKSLLIVTSRILSFGPQSLLSVILWATVAIAIGCAISKIRYL